MTCGGTAFRQINWKSMSLILASKGLVLPERGCRTLALFVGIHKAFLGKVEEPLQSYVTKNPFWSSCPNVGNFFFLIHFIMAINFWIVFQSFEKFSFLWDTELSTRRLLQPAARRGLRRAQRDALAQLGRQRAAHHPHLGARPHAQGADAGHQLLQAHDCQDAGPPGKERNGVGWRGVVPRHRDT